MKNIIKLFCLIIIFVNIINAQTNQDTIEVSTGWNMIGALSTGATLQIISSEPTGIISSAFYGYNPGASYYQADTLKRGNGYWVKVKQNGLIIFSSYFSSPNIPTLLLPLDDEEDIRLSPMFVWNSSSRATSYTLQISTDSLFLSYIYNQSGLTDTSLQFSNLSNSTTYYWRVNAKNSYGTSSWSSVWNFATVIGGGAPCPGIPTVTYAGKTYNTGQIGDQCWLKENLNVGIMIDGLQNQTNNGMIEKYCHSNDPANCSTYGGLYQWDEAMQYSTIWGAQGICPPGWHIPTQTELLILTTTVGLDGNALKEIGQGTGDGAGTNTSGFSALLAGARSNNGSFNGLGITTYFWDSIEVTATIAGYLYLHFTNSTITLNARNKAYGHSVRCVKN